MVIETPQGPPVLSLELLRAARERLDRQAQTAFSSYTVLVHPDLERRVAAIMAGCIRGQWPRPKKVSARRRTLADRGRTRSVPRNALGADIDLEVWR